ncbi:receptor expression-enhancing protein 1-like [Stomoxys calcitrans]|uniref:receptor expression-enhancing protein 1-like n=1 Tax=Stomoxys calcitrans TaxID=35570 RepID=UPI0027E23EEE|nr:receptor expression-enhancing protein 1-like [Stomoxys calcitrans]
MISSICSRLTILIFGTLYPAYYSFKAVRTKTVDEYMKWMTYWIVFAIFTAAETFTDVFLTWLPFYYELKILLILWLLPSMGNGSPVLYRKCLHPFLKKHESRIDRALEQMQNRGQDMIFQYASEAVLFLGRGIMDILYKNMPNGLLGLMANSHGVNNDDRTSRMRPVASSTMLIEELDDPQPSTSSNGKLRKRKTTPGRKTTKDVAGEANTEQNDQKTKQTRGRGRKARDTKAEYNLDINLNEN